MRTNGKTAIVTGGSRGIGAGVVAEFLARGYRVVATSRDVSRSGAFAPSKDLELVDGDIADPATAARVVDAAASRFGSVDALVNNAGIYFAKAFTDYTADDFRRFVDTNLAGYLFVTQLAVARMLAQGTGGSVVCVTSAMVEHPIAGVRASVPMLTKGGLEAITRSLAMEYATQGVRFNAVAPGIVDTPLHAGDSADALRALSPTGEISDVADVVDAVVYLTEARHVTAEVLRVDAGMHNGKW